MPLEPSRFHACTICHIHGKRRVLYPAFVPKTKTLEPLFCASAVIKTAVVGSLLGWRFYRTGKNSPIFRYAAISSLCVSSPRIPNNPVEYRRGPGAIRCPSPSRGAREAKRWAEGAQTLSDIYPSWRLTPSSWHVPSLVVLQGSALNTM